MLKRLLHKLWSHKWDEMAFCQAATDSHPAIYSLYRRCSCGQVQCAQVAGDPLAMRSIMTTDLKTAELDALRGIVGIGPAEHPKYEAWLAERIANDQVRARDDSEYARFRRDAGLPPV
jgi:hypothetical protein